MQTNPADEQNKNVKRSESPWNQNHQSSRKNQSGREECVGESAVRCHDSITTPIAAEK